CSGARVAQQPASTAPVRPAEEMPAFGIIPIPATVEESASAPFVVGENTGIVVEAGNADAARVGLFLADLIGNRAESKPNVTDAGAAIPAGSIYLTTQGADVSLGEEGYELTVTPERVTISAWTPAGLFYGVQTLRQLLPPSVEYQATYDRPMLVPAVHILDHPRFEWRGAMLDVARHFFSTDDVKRYIDLMAMYKLNRLHLHLSDDQGWRIEIPSWPNLTKIGGQTEVGGGPGGFYTQEEFTDLVRYAQDRFITIVPEIDMPGHTNAALASYPELNCNGEAPPHYTGTRVGFSVLCVDKDVTYEFIDDVVRDISAVSPGPYFHIGGDEVRKLTPEQYRQFIERTEEIVRSHGKKVIGWDETAVANPVPGTVVQLWRPEASHEMIAGAVAKGAAVVLSPAAKIYLDMKYDSTTVLGQSWAAIINVREGYDWEPTAILPDIPEQSILGVEAPIWTETMATMDDVEYLAFPRLAGAAEIAWSPAAKRDWNTYRLRLGAQAPRWSALGINFYRSPMVPWNEEVKAGRMKDKGPGV
ncbi:MAG TPA: beta-N-acetylhexosaminidase, partial [Rhodothermales bacterium]|nr:beta-N-acetylhexosaminidase [Rhodothermales bacterium]